MVSPGSSLGTALLILACLTARGARAQDLARQATVIDGDTIEIHGQRIRLNGIDAPESRQACPGRNRKEYRYGQKAAVALADEIGRATVTCRQTDTDRYARIVATCFRRRADLNQWMVRQG
ncbi:thermonuclease family protein [Microvirga puerhi]|uniref:Thermonuclease family protein n=1 Tax=Microvirga puerhi TaxID=2876078 RepID=A0ABS7VJU2_9HYPH|nr:thermonuclease family protein [Microvirga puerhi]